jgi:hypothetical protein
MSILVRVVKTAEVDDSIAEEMLSKFIDWLDDKGILSADDYPVETPTNRDLVKQFLEEWG